MKRNIVSGLVLAGIAVLCCGCADRMFYYPTRRVYSTPAASGLSYEQVTFASRDGTALSGWFAPAVDTPKGTVIHFHGNAQNMTAHFSYVSWLPKEGFDVFVFDYRGYGRSAGAPSREGIYEDCIAAVEYVASRDDVHPNRLLIFGQSIGGANALAVMGHEQFPGVRGVATESAFYSYRLIVRDKLRQIPLVSLIRWPLSFVIVSNGKSPAHVIDNISPVPLLLIHGTADGVVPHYHGQKLLAAAGEPKELVSVPGGRHTGSLMRHGDTYRERLVDFFERSLRDD